MSRPLAEWLVTHAIERPLAPSLIDAPTTWSNAALARVTADVAERLGSTGVGSGSRLASLLGDGAPAVVLIHACRRLGATLVPLNRRAATAELRAQLAAAAVTTVVHDTEHAAAAAEVTRAGGRMIAFEPAWLAPSAAGGDDARDARTTTPPGRPVPDRTTPATILFTSGTTGAPKAVVLSHVAHLASADAWAQRLEPRPTDRWLACLPLFHVAGIAMVIRASRWGVPLDVRARFDAAAVDRAIEEDGVSHLSLVPSLLGQLLDVRDGRATPATLRAILLGGGPIPDALLERSRAVGLPIVTTYGMTETASGVAAGDGTGRLRPLPGVGLRIRPPGGDAPGRAEHGASEERGEIVLDGPMLFDGYIGPAGELPPPGPVRDFGTGDLGRLEPDGSLHVIGRGDDLIISGGENIAPAEVEAALLTLGAIREAAVIGLPDERWGSVPIAAVVLVDGESMDDATILAACRERLAGFKVPAAIHRLDALPHDAAGKVDRRRLRDRLVAHEPR